MTYFSHTLDVHWHNKETMARVLDEPKNLNANVLQNINQELGKLNENYQFILQRYDSPHEASSPSPRRRKKLELC
jgi:hypothetical protein